jgi:hypothetical protein
MTVSIEMRLSEINIDLLLSLAITLKEFGKEDNNGLDSMQWHNREKDWYNAERRFIFAAPSAQMKAKWINLITKQKRICVNSSQRLEI